MTKKRVKNINMYMRGVHRSMKLNDLKCFGKEIDRAIAKMHQDIKKKIKIRL